MLPKFLRTQGSDIDLSPANFPFMSMKHAHIGGLPARIFRISFTGELSYEINVAARHGLALWTYLMKVGAAHGITPYGTEAMHVLRAEKGFIIVGQETDGSVNPYDLGMDWIVSEAKPDFIGKRALSVKAWVMIIAKSWLGFYAMILKRLSQRERTQLLILISPCQWTCLDRSRLPIFHRIAGVQLPWQCLRAVTD